MNIAIITGASSGIGKEFAFQIARRYASKIDEFWLIARRNDKLAETAAQISDLYGFHCIPIPMDVTDRNQMDLLRERLINQHAVIQYLVNAAGMAKIGGPFTISREDSLDMIELNCSALVNMTMLCLPFMVKGSHVLQLASTAAFQPMQGMNIYAASKAFVLRYTQALRWELIGKRIHVTAVCPYWVKNTEFMQVAKDTGNDKGKKAVRHMWLSTGAKPVVAWALFANFLGFWVTTPGPICFAHRICAKILPPIVMMGGWEGIRRL